jgi:predicted TIM-barrel fold metal-dependent hydrolase
LATLSGAGIRLAMVGPAPVDGKRFSHPDLDPVWAAFCDHGITPVFHVGGFRGPLDPAWYEPEEPGDRLLDSVFLWLAPAVALADLILQGTFERFPDLRVGVVELTAGWVPTFLLHLDGARDFHTARHGRPLRDLARRPSEYFSDHVRVAALSYERPDRLIRAVGEDVFMFGSDWPHAEGIADPVADYRAALTSDISDRAAEQLFGGNLRWLLREETPAPH